MLFQQLSSPAIDVDVAILVASYEGRCAHIANELARAGFTGRVLILYCADAMTVEVRRHLEELTTIFTSRCEVVPVSIQSAAPMISYARSVLWPAKMLIDMTCFNRENLFAFLWATRIGVQSFPELVLAYTAPITYGSWLSAQYGPAHNIIGFAGATAGRRGRHLLCCVGFESERANKIIQALEPSSVTLAVGTRPTRQEFLKRNKAAVTEVLGSSNFEVREINVVDPNVCFEDLQAIVTDHPNDTIHIAPFNTKLSCMAIYSLWLRDNRIRVWNTQPRSYNTADYSKGIGDARYLSVKWDLDMAPPLAAH